MKRFLKVILTPLTSALFLISAIMIHDDLTALPIDTTDGQSIIGIGIWLSLRIILIFFSGLISLVLLILLFANRNYRDRFIYTLLVINLIIGVVNSILIL